MKEILIRAGIDSESDKILTAIKHKGFTEGEEYNLEQIILTIGILENLKQQMLDKLKTLGRIRRSDGS
jgi:hypothetical protein